MSERGAHGLAQMIRDYWRERGFAPSVWVERMESMGDNDRAVWIVRSDMVNGVPHG